MTPWQRAFWIGFALAAPWAIMILIVGLIFLLLSGCSTAPKPVVKDSFTTPPLPVGVQSVQNTHTLAVSRQAAVIGPPAPVLLSLTWQGGVLPRAGFSTNLPACYRVEVSRDLVTWAVLTNLVAPGPDYSVQTLAVGTNFFRVREAQPWEVSP